MSLTKTIFLSLSVVIAIALNFLEYLIPLGGMIPGIKIGISNIIILTVIYIYSVKEGIFTAVMKSVLLALLFGNGSSFVYSITGGVVSSLGMGMFKNMKSLSPIGVSLIGSFLHITAQIVTAFVMLGSHYVFYYYPYMLLAGTVTGALNGFLVKTLLSGQYLKFKR